MAEERYSKEDLDRLAEYVRLSEKAKESITDYAEVAKKISELKAQRSFFQKQETRTHNKILDYTKKIEQGEKNLSNLQGQKLIDAKDELEVLKKKKKITIKDNHLAQERYETAKDLGGELAKHLNLANGMWATLGSTSRVLGTITRNLYKQKDYLLQQQKSVKMTELQMGLLSKQSTGFRNSLYGAAMNTNQLGINTEKLGKMQGNYSSEIGRMVMLSEEGNIAMAELASGTILGSDNAAQFAASMERFGYSVKASKKFMEETLHISHAMGLNSGKVTENLRLSLEKANTYNFSGGVAGVQKMAMLATKFRLDINAVAGMADKLIEPEGAIEMASQLSVLGGEWSKIGDPFNLMFKSRNDMAGLIEDIANAASGTAQFNQETGEFEISSMELHRLRKVAAATGISYGELADSAKQAAKFTRIRASIVGDFDEDVMKYIEAVGEFDGDSKEFKINIDGDEVFVRDLHQFSNARLKEITQERKNLRQRAQDSKTFDEMLDNIINQFKSTLLPGFDVFSDSVLKGLTNFSEWMIKDDVLGNLQTVGRQIGNMASAVAKLVINNPIESAIALLIGKGAIWLARGRLLGIGFNSATKMGGGGGLNSLKNPKNLLSKKPSMLGKGGGATRLMKGAGGLMAAGSMAFDGFNNFSNDSLTTGDAIGKTLDQNKYALMGAALGSFIPVLGTLAGAGIGSLVDMAGSSGVMGGDGLWGSYDTPQNNSRRVNQDFVSRPGQKPIPFSAADTLIGMKKGGGIDNFISKNEGTSKKNGDLKIFFDRPLIIEGKVELVSKGQSAIIDLDNPMLIRALSKKVQEELTISLNGKRNANPIS